jgi:hypothetical protein
MTSARLEKIVINPRIFFRLPMFCRLPVLPGLLAGCDPSPLGSF